MGGGTKVLVPRIGGASGLTPGPGIGCAAAVGIRVAVCAACVAFCPLAAGAFGSFPVSDGHSASVENEQADNATTAQMTEIWERELAMNGPHP